MVRWLHLASMVCVALLSLSPARAGDSRVPQPVIEAARSGTTCIADPTIMRRDHPSMLKHQRDLTVHGGIRGAKASLKGCIDCHASAVTGSVAQADSNFCVSCHQYAAVSIDCFDCHATRPQAKVIVKQP
jgi:predicted CXXCH cytochrome family protein